MLSDDLLVLYDGIAGDGLNPCTSTQSAGDFAPQKAGDLRQLDAVRQHNREAETMDHLEDPKPGFQWPIVVAEPINAPAKKVWNVISMPGNLELCHPFCLKNPVNEWPGEGSRDEVHYLSGWIYERKFCRWIEGVGYDLEIGRVGGGKSFVSWRIKPSGMHSCYLRIAVYPHILQNIAVAIRWLPHILYIRPLLRRYLSSVTKGFEWYVSRGEPVPRNQFGDHPWFSAS